MPANNTAALPATNTRALAVRLLAGVCTETFAVWLRRVVGPVSQADALSALLVLADDIVWAVQRDPAFVADAARRGEVVVRLRSQALGAGLPTRDHWLNLAVEITVTGLKATGRLPANAGHG